VVVPPHVVEAVQARVAAHVPKQGQVVAAHVPKVKDSQIGSRVGNSGGGAVEHQEKVSSSSNERKEMMNKK
jgi:hypothetical protein